MRTDASELFRLIDAYAAAREERHDKIDAASWAFHDAHADMMTARCAAADALAAHGIAVTPAPLADDLTRLAERGAIRAAARAEAEGGAVMTARTARHRITLRLTHPGARRPRRRHARHELGRAMPRERRRRRRGGAVMTARAPRRTLTPAEVLRHAKAMPARLAVADATGVRPGELFALARRDVHDDARTVCIARTLVGTAPASLRLVSVASGTVAVPDCAREALRDHLAEYVAPDPDALVFATSHGSPLTAPHRSRLIARASCAAGIDRTRWHDLRCTLGPRAKGVQS